MRRKAKQKYNVPTDFNNLTDSNEHISLSQNGRRTLYTKGNSDCEDNDDAVGNEASSISYTQPSTSRAARSEINYNENQIIASGSNATAENPEENVSLEKDLILPNSTEEPSMTTMDDGEPRHLSCIENVPVVNGTEQFVEMVEQVEPKRTKKSTKSNAKAKTVPQRAPRSRNKVETKASDDTSANTEGLRRSTRSRNINPWAAGTNVYEIACQRAIGTKRKPASPERTKEPEAENESRATKKRRIAEKPNQVAKVQAKKFVPTSTAKSKRDKERKKETTEMDGEESNRIFTGDYLYQITKDIGWFNDLWSKRALPTFVNQERVYKIHTNRMGSVKIGKNDDVPTSAYCLVLIFVVSFIQKVRVLHKSTIFRKKKSIMAFSQELLVWLVLCDSTKVLSKLHLPPKTVW